MWTYEYGTMCRCVCVFLVCVLLLAATQVVLSYLELSVLSEAELEGKSEPDIEKTDSSVPMAIAEEYKNKYDFENALVWYERVIQDFPGTVAAGNACLNKLAILQAEGNWYLSLSLDFWNLKFAQMNDALRYSRNGPTGTKLRRECQVLAEKANEYRLLGLKKGKELREQFYHFERNYPSMLGKLSIPSIRESGKTPPIVVLEESEIARMLALGTEEHLEYESRRKFMLDMNFMFFCLGYMGLAGGERPNEHTILLYHDGVLEKTIDSSGLYCWLGISLANQGQQNAALSAFQKVIDLCKDDPYSKLGYEAEKRTSGIKHKAPLYIDSLMIDLSDEEKKIAEQYIERYTGEDPSRSE